MRRNANRVVDRFGRCHGTFAKAVPTPLKDLPDNAFFRFKNGLPGRVYQVLWVRNNIAWDVNSSRWVRSTTEVAQYMSLFNGNTYIPRGNPEVYHLQ